MKKTTISGLVIVLVLIFGYFVYTNNSGMHMNMSEGEDFFSQEVDENTPFARESEIVVLKDGDTYEMVASVVKQEVGNRVVKRLAYNQQIPGPVLKVEKNAEITLNFTNNLDVETTLHSHGLRLDNEFDGVPDVTQKPIKIGESFTYKLTFPD
jgi:FtsP/CotA-like multicopper oxidase with cupredoxin domain